MYRNECYRYHFKDNLKMDISPRPLRFASRVSPNAETSNVGSHFFSLPLEIHYLIYDKLLVQSHELRTFYLCKNRDNLRDPTVVREYLSPSLLRTSKAILDEACPPFTLDTCFPFCATSHLPIQPPSIL